ncbi:MAG: hypothetical protein K1V80_03170 [Muribaculaceae bacterium]|uniref:hypothetical protein n=1 Tax=uncultured Muribaculum sp. TaxID=1918613 RepID=UPI0026EEBA6C|nr:hypothetical protein [uncultured Muribaculum sp.]
MSKNPYEYLKTDCLEDVAPVESQSTWQVTDSNDESIFIHTSQLPDGHWVYGYMVYWKNGRQSMLRTSAENGLFNSQRESQLYAIGFMRLYLSYFQAETRDAITRAESRLIQAELF